MAYTLKQVEEFAEAANNWNLERLYIDLASAKGKGLTPVEKKILRGLLCGYSPSEIADAIYKTRNSSSVRVYLSNALYKYIEAMLVLKAEKQIKISHWSRVINLLEQVGYKTYSLPRFQGIDLSFEASCNQGNCSVSTAKKGYDWGEAIDVGIFYGREKELAQTEQWIVTERCRLVALLGMGGVGKTALSVKLAEQIQNKFDYAIWRSLRHAPPLEDLLANLIQFLSQERETETIPETIAGRISQLIDCLRTSRCLLVLDSVDSILQPNTYTGNFRQGYEAYGDLFKRVGEVLHQSCLVLTSREKLKELAAMEGAILPVRSLPIRGLEETECQELIKAKGVSGSEQEWKLLIKRYAGNPLALKLVLTTIIELFDGKISEFLKQNVLGFGGVRELLEEQLNRLSEVERQVMYWLAIHQELVLEPESEREITPSVSRAELIETLESLGRRSLIYKIHTSIQPQFIFKEYLKERLTR